MEACTYCTIGTCVCPAPWGPACNRCPCRSCGARRGWPADRAFQFMSKLYTTYLELYSVLVPGLVLGLGLVHLGHAVQCWRSGAFSWWGACSHSPSLCPWWPCWRWPSWTSLWSPFCQSPANRAFGLYTRWILRTWALLSTCIWAVGLCCLFYCLLTIPSSL